MFSCRAYYYADLIIIIPLLIIVVPLIIIIIIIVGIHICITSKAPVLCTVTYS